MGKKKEVNGFKYRRQGSIDDENFLMLAHSLGNIKNSIDNFFLTEKEYEEIKNQINTIDSIISNINDKLQTIDAEISKLNSDLINDGPASHNSFFRGKYLGSSVTSAQANAISDGTFDDLYIGDYWTIGDVNYRIAAFDYFYRTGSNSSLTTHHAVIVPDTILYRAPMNSSNTTDGGYVGSAMYTCDSITVDGTTYTGLKDAIFTIQSAFGSYVVAHEVYLDNSTTSGYPSGGAWFTDRICDLMTEHMVYGGPVVEQMSYGGTRVYNYRIEKSQLPLFALDSTKINIREAYWLRDVVSSLSFANASSTGLANSNNASNVFGVRPYFFIS